MAVDETSKTLNYATVINFSNAVNGQSKGYSQWCASVFHPRLQRTVAIFNLGAHLQVA